MPTSMRMRQSLAEIEAAFVDEIEEDRERRERLQARAERRERVRHLERAREQGSMRFAVVDEVPGIGPSRVEQLRGLVVP